MCRHLSVRRLLVSLLLVATYASAVPAGDALEPNDSFQQATAIFLPACTPGFLAADNLEISPQGQDVDFFKFETDVAARLSIDIDGHRGSALDSLIGVFDSDFQLLALNDDGSAPGEVPGGDSFLEVLIPSDRPLYLAVTSSLDIDFNGGPDHTTGGVYSMLITCLEGKFCGDSVVVAPETCDPPGQPAGRPDACRDDCSYCGDGRIDTGTPETCDDGNNIDGDGCDSGCQSELCAESVIGLLSELRGDSGFLRAMCLGPYAGLPEMLVAVDKLPDPPPGDGYYFRGRDRCAGESFGDPWLDANSPCPGTVCLGSAVSLSAERFICNDQATVTVHECDDAGDLLVVLSSVEVASRTTLQVLDSLGNVLDQETGLDVGFTQPVSHVARYLAEDIPVSDAAVSDPGNGVLDIAGGDRIRVIYADEIDGVPDPAKRRIVEAAILCE